MSRKRRVSFDEELGMKKTLKEFKNGRTQFTVSMNTSNDSSELIADFESFLKEKYARQVTQFHLKI